MSFKYMMTGTNIYGYDQPTLKSKSKNKNNLINSYEIP